MKTHYNSGLFIIKLQNWLTHKIGSRVLASFLSLYVPFILVGIYLQVISGYEIFSRGVLISTFWLGLAPLLIQEAWHVINVFFDSHKHLFKNEKEWLELKEKSLRKLESPKYIYFAIPWALATSVTVNFIMFRDAPHSIQAWCLLIYFVMFFVSAIGFQGILLVNKIISSLLEQDIVFNPYHPDSFGGLQSLSNFLVKGTLYFSTGSLVLPLVFEMLSNFSGDIKILGYAVYFLTGIFISLLLYSFLKPILEIKLFIEDKKEACILASQLKLKELYNSLDEKDENISNAIKLYTYNDLYHKKLYSIKEYPYDFSVIAQLTLSLIIPISISAIEKYLF